MSPLPSFLVYLLALTVLVGAIYDLRFRRIPNWLSVSALVAALAYRAYWGGWTELRSGLAGFGLAFGVYFLFYLIRTMRAGDVKLMAAVGAISGYPNWYPLFILTSVLGGIVALIVVVYKGRLKQTLSNVAFILWEIAHLKKPFEARPALDAGSVTAITLPHGFAIALGSLLFLLLSSLPAAT